MFQSLLALVGYASAFLVVAVAVAWRIGGGLKLAGIGGGLALAFGSLSAGLFPTGSEHSPLRFAGRGNAGGADEAVAATSGAEAKRLCIEWLDEGDAALRQVKDFRGVMHRQERVDGVLGAAEAMQIKMRAEPCAAYMRWTEPKAGRELIWSPHANDGMILVHECGWKGKVAPIVRLAPDDPLVVASSRHGIEELGLWSLMETLRRERSDLDRPGASVELAVDQEIGGRDCYSFTVKFAEPVDDLDRSRVVIYLDKQQKIPLGYELYGWPAQAGEEPPLLEAFYYEGLEFNVGLADKDFDPANEEYRFLKKRGRRAEAPQGSPAE